MGWEYSLGTGIGAGAAVISGAVAALAWRHRREKGALPFTVLMGNLALWSALYGFQLGYETLAAQLVVQRFTLGVAGFVPTTWLLFALAYAGYESWLERRRVALLVAEPVAFLLVCLTNPAHGLVWTDAELTSSAVGSVPALALGAGYAVHIFYAYVAVAAGIGLFLQLGGRVSPMHQKQVALLITGAVPPFLSHVLFTFRASPVPGLDLTPFVFSFTGVVFGLALFRFELLELSPVARLQSLEEMGDGLVVIDERGVVVDRFGVAAAVLEPAPRVGDRIGTVFPDTDLDALDGSYRSARVNGRQRSYRLEVSPLRDHHDRQTGTMVTIRDVTALRESEQRLRVSDRVLRHNVRNDVGIVHGYASELETRLEGRDAADARLIRETAEGLLETAEKARKITHLHRNVATDGEAVDLAEQLRSVVSGFRTGHPGVTFRTDVPDEARVTVGDPETFRTAIRNVLENTVEHNETTALHVTVSMTRTPEGYRIEIADDGGGIPDLERRVLEDGMETPLHHGQGLGLWLTYWCVRMWGGDLSLESDADGSTVTMTVPAGPGASGEASGDGHG